MLELKLGRFLMIKSKIKMILTLIIVVIATVIAGLFVMTGIAFADSDSSDFKNGHGTVVQL